MNPVFIYTLIDPITLEVRYVGKTEDPERRYLGHLHVLNKNRKDYNEDISHRANWIRKLSKRGTVPIFSIIEEVSIDNWQEREREWIKYFVNKDCPLTNMTKGGEGI